MATVKQTFTIPKETSDKLSQYVDASLATKSKLITKLLEDFFNKLPQFQNKNGIQSK